MPAAHWPGSAVTSAAAGWRGRPACCERALWENSAATWWARVSTCWALPWRRRFVAAVAWLAGARVPPCSGSSSRLQLGEKKSGLTGAAGATVGAGTCLRLQRRRCWAGPADRRGAGTASWLRACSLGARGAGLAVGTILVHDRRHGDWRATGRCGPPVHRTTEFWARGTGA